MGTRVQVNREIAERIMEVLDIDKATAKVIMDDLKINSSQKCQNGPWSRLLLELRTMKLHRVMSTKSDLSRIGSN